MSLLHAVLALSFLFLFKECLLCVNACKYPQRSEAQDPPGDGVKDGCEPLNGGTRN